MRSEDLVDQSTLRDFEERGYAIVRGAFEGGELDAVVAELEELGQYLVGPTFSVSDSTAYSMNAAQQSVLYDRLKYMMSLARLEGSTRVRELCRALGMKFPALMGCSNMRMDRPSDERHLFEWHQDTLYLLGSENAVTLWLPLGDVNEHNGTIQVIAGSHKRGIYPFRRLTDKPSLRYVPFLQRDLALDYEVTESPHTVVASRGDAVIFKQMLLHRSTPNFSNQIRWTVQLRITDLGDENHRAQGFPSGDRTNIFFVRYPNNEPIEVSIP